MTEIRQEEEAAGEAGLPISTSSPRSPRTSSHVWRPEMLLTLRQPQGSPLPAQMTQNKMLMVLKLRNPDLI